MNRPIRVLSILEADVVTGPAGNLLRFAKAARASGRAEVMFATYRRGDVSQQTAFQAAVNQAGFDLDLIPERSPLDFRVIAGLRDLLKKRNPDIVQTHAVKSHFLMGLIASNDRPKWIAFHHGYTQPILRVRVYNQFDRWSLRRPDAIVTVCQAFAGELQDRGVARDRITVIHNSIEKAPESDSQAVDAIRSELGIAAGERVIVAIGRLSAEKAQSDLLTAVAQLIAGGQEKLRLVIVGDGPDKVKLEEQSARLGLKDAAIFAGFRSRPGPFFQLASVFVLPSLSEGSPNVLLEAMAANVPIVATSVGGIPDTIEDGVSGLLTPPRNPAALSSSIARILSEPALGAQLAAEAHRQVSSRFSPEIYRDRLLAVYERQLSA